MSRAAVAAESVKAAIEAFDHGLSISVVTTRAFSDPEKLEPNRIEITVYPLTKTKKREGKKIVVETIEVDVVVQRKLAPTDKANIDVMLDFVEQLDWHLEGYDFSPFTYFVDDDNDPLWLPDFLHVKNILAAMITVNLAIKRPMGP